MAGVRGITTRPLGPSLRGPHPCPGWERAVFWVFVASGCCCSRPSQDHVEGVGEAEIC